MNSTIITNDEQLVIDLTNARQAGVRRGILASVDELNKLRMGKQTAEREILRLAIMALLELKIAEVEG